MSGRPETSRPILAAFRGDQLKPTVILLVSPVLMLTWWYFGSPEAYYRLQAAWPRLVLFRDAEAAAAVYSFAACFLLLGLVPAVIVKLLFRQRLVEYGVGLGDRVRTLRSLLLLAPVMVLAAYLSSLDREIYNAYPINRNREMSAGVFAVHACTYLMFYLGWEFHFRGFLQFGLCGKLGAANALLVQVMASSLLHVGKPCAETYAAIGGGILWGLIAYRTRSLLSGVLQHALLGIALDWFICYL